LNSNRFENITLKNKDDNYKCDKKKSREDKIENRSDDKNFQVIDGGCKKEFKKP